MRNYAVCAVPCVMNKTGSSRGSEVRVRDVPGGGVWFGGNEKFQKISFPHPPPPHWRTLMS